MCKIKLLITAITFNCFFSLIYHTQAQNLKWASSIGGEGDDIGTSVTTDAAGNIYTTGFFNGKVDFNPNAGVFNYTSKGQEDIFIMKLDAKGNFVWAKQIGGDGLDHGNAITTDEDGNVYTTGYFEGTVDFNPGSGVFNLTSDNQINIFISKLDASGNFMWAKKLGGTYGFGSSIITDYLGNVYTCGSFFQTIDFNPSNDTFNLTSVGETDIFISKLNKDGNFVWAKKMGGTLYDYCNGITIDISGGLYTTGYFEGTADFNPGNAIVNLTSSSEYDFFISRLDTAGNFAWAKAIGGVSWDIGNSITTDPNGNVYTTGNFNETVDFNPNQGVFNLISSEGSDDIFVLKLSAAGDFVWAKKMGGSSTDESYAIVTDALGAVYTTGYFRQTADFDPNSGIFNLNAKGSYDVFVSKLDNAGNFVWAKSVGGYESDYGKSIVLVAGDVIITGSFQDTADFDPYLDVFNLKSYAANDAFLLRLSPCAARVTVLSTTLSANQQQGASYQWINCDNKQPISGENKRIFTAKTTGNYAVIVSTSSCSDTSSCTNITITGMSNTVTFSPQINIYPNPNIGTFVLEAKGLNASYDITITDVLGKAVFTQQSQNTTAEIDLRNQPNGTYFIRLKTENEVVNQKIIIQK